MTASRLTLLCLCSYLDLLPPLHPSTSTAGLCFVLVTGLISRGKLSFCSLDFKDDVRRLAIMTQVSLGLIPLNSAMEVERVESS